MKKILTIVTAFLLITIIGCADSKVVGVVDTYPIDKAFLFTMSTPVDPSEVEGMIVVYTKEHKIQHPIYISTLESDDTILVVSPLEFPYQYNTEYVIEVKEGLIAETEHFEFVTEQYPMTEDDINSLLKDAGVRGLMSEKSKIKHVYEYIKYEYEYTQDYLTVEQMIAEGRGDCTAKATLFKLMLDQLDIPCEIVPVETGLYDDDDPTDTNFYRHSWNLVYYKDSWFHVDATWGDHTFLLKDEELPFDYRLQNN